MPRDNLTSDIILKELFKRPNPKARQFYNHYSEDRVLANVEVDLMELPKDADGSRYLYVMIDVASRFVHGYPLKTKAAEGVLTSIKHYIKHYGKPVTITSDQGSESDNRLVKNFLKSENINFDTIPKAHHLAFVENANGRIALEIFRVQQKKEIMTEDTQRDWVKILPKILKEMNKRKNKITNLSPVEAFKRKTVPLHHPERKISDMDKNKFHPVGTIVRRLLGKHEILRTDDMTISSDTRRKTDPFWSYKTYRVTSVYRPLSGTFWYHIIEDSKTGVNWKTSLNYWSLLPTVQ